MFFAKSSKLAWADSMKKWLKKCQYLDVNSSSESENLSCLNIPILSINIPIVDWFEETNFYVGIPKYRFIFKTNRTSNIEAWLSSLMSDIPPYYE